MKRDLGNTRSPTPLVSNEDTEAQEFHLAQGEFTAQGYNRKLCHCSLSRTCFVPGLCWVLHPHCPLHLATSA